MTIQKNLMNLVVAVFAATILLHSGSNSRAAEPRRVVVDIKGFKFVPARPVVTPGDTIVWINKDIVPHTVTAKDGSWDSGLIEVGKQWKTTITPELTQDYYCAFHPSMIAGLSVNPGPVTSSQVSPPYTRKVFEPLPADAEAVR